MFLPNGGPARAHGLARQLGVAARPPQDSPGPGIGFTPPALSLPSINQSIRHHRTEQHEHTYETDPNKPR